MGTKIKVLMVSAIIITFYPLSIDNYASAGFYDWMVSKETITSSINFPIIRETAGSFDKFFAWNNAGNQPVMPSILSSSNNDLALEQQEAVKVIRTYTVRATAYSSTPDQTDDTPFITAKGTLVRDGLVAANFLPFGTKIRIPNLYGEKIFVVEDRMNARYWYNIDIWFPERSLAKAFGSQRVTIEIVEES